MPRLLRTEEQIQQAKMRTEEYRKFFRYFDSISEGVKWVKSILHCQSITAMVWRMRKGYGIPERKLEILRAKAMKDKRFEGLYPY